MDLTDEAATPMGNGSPNVATLTIDNPSNRRCLRVLPLDRTQRGRRLVARRGASSQQHGRLADPVSLLPFTDGRSGWTTEQFAPLVSPRHTNGLYSTCPQTAMVPRLGRGGWRISS
jgi:hypothetical protein